MPRPTPRLPKPTSAWLLGCLLAVSCASSSPSASLAKDPAAAANAARYPRRAPGCDVALYHTPVPGVSAWDDLGVVEASCHISGSSTECLRLLKAEACRLGGDLLYNVPRQPFRPRDQVLLYRGQVAHTKVRALKTQEDPDLPPPATAEEAAGPVVPLPSAPPPPVEAP